MYSSRLQIPIASGEILKPSRNTQIGILHLKQMTFAAADTRRTRLASSESLQSR
jgi:hypothetical protein